MLTSNPRLNSTVQLDVRLIEADRVTTPDLKAEQSSLDGITFDSFGNPTSYSMLTEHPDGLVTSWSSEFRRYPAEAVLHYFRVDRPGQSRGIPDITPALPLVAQLTRYTLAVITAAEMAALPDGVLYTDSPPNGEATDIEPMDLVEMQRGMLMTVAGRWDSSRPNSPPPPTANSNARFPKRSRCA